MVEATGCGGWAETRYGVFRSNYLLFVEDFYCEPADAPAVGLFPE